MTGNRRYVRYAPTFFSTPSSRGVPSDITPHELRGECFFPADAASEALLRSFARKGDAE
jgi:hypothetical protein